MERIRKRVGRIFHESVLVTSVYYNAGRNKPAAGRSTVVFEFTSLWQVEPDRQLFFQIEFISDSRQGSQKSFDMVGRVSMGLIISDLIIIYGEYHEKFKQNVESLLARRVRPDYG